MLFRRPHFQPNRNATGNLELQQLRKKISSLPIWCFATPYFLDFLGLKETYQEKDLESAILREMESFILELGVGFAFLIDKNESPLMEPTTMLTFFLSPPFTKAGGC